MGTRQAGLLRLELGNFAGDAGVHAFEALRPLAERAWPSIEGPDSLPLPHLHLLHAGLVG